MESIKQKKKKEKNYKYYSKLFDVSIDCCSDTADK